MRQILFRGKRVDNGEWVVGDLIHRQVWSCSLTIIRVSDDGFDHYEEYEVIPETVGQFTNLTDKNGNKIFEGDIVKITDKIVGYERFAFIEFGNPNAQYDWGWQLHPISKEPFAVAILHWVDMEESGAFIEVIGNIHEKDIDELLKEYEK